MFQNTGILTLPEKYNNSEACDIYLAHMYGHEVSAAPPVKHKLCLEYSEKMLQCHLAIRNPKSDTFFKAIYIKTNMKTYKKQEATKLSLDAT
jgi:hypothetical protein